jgi:hypothetical protein
MLKALVEAVCARLGTLPGVATCRPYAGELAASTQAPLLVPALLVVVAELKAAPEDGTGRAALTAALICYVCTRFVGNAVGRGDEAWALAEAVLARAHLARWGLAGVDPARLLGARPIWSFETAAGMAVREVRWAQDLRLGVSEWDGGATPTEIYLGIAPRIGPDHVDDYWRVDALPELP